jgi:leader peptidase (prepilin peptidase) / N-methyltransferase
MCGVGWVGFGVAGCAGLAGMGAGWIARVVLGRLRYPVRVPFGVAEGVLGLVWAVVAVRAMAGGLPAWWLPVPAALSWLAVVLTATDLAHRRLPNVITGPAYPAAGGLLAITCAAGAGFGLGGRAIAAGAVLFAVYAVVHLAAPSQLGAGDVKLAGVVGVALGAVSWPALLLGQVIAAVITVLLAVIERHERGAPHGPGMLAGALLVVMFPGAIMPAT